MAEELAYVRAYFYRGQVPKGWPKRPDVDDPPAAGWTHVVVVPGKRLSTLLCPYTLWSAQVTSDCLELERSEPMALDPVRLAERIRKNWETRARLGVPADYDVAALVLTRLGAEVPTVVANQQQAEPKERGGKEAMPANLRPMRRESKRGIVAEFFIGGNASIREAMARFSMSRSGVLSHLFCINRDHGLAYVLSGECARIDVPDGWDPFAVEVPQPTTPRSEGEAPDQRPPAKEKSMARKPGGKPTDPSRLKPIKRGSQRARVAELFVGEQDLAAAAERLGVTRGAVLSHLFTIWKEHGIGYEVRGDAARLLVPEGFVLLVEPEKK